MIGLHECCLPVAQFSQCGQYTCVYFACVDGCDGCGLWVRTSLANGKHFAVLHQDPSRLAVVIRAPCFSLNAMVLHAPVEGGDINEAWWAETLRIQALLPQRAHNLYFVDANGRVGSSISEAIGSVMAEVETVNGWLCSSMAVVYSCSCILHVSSQRRICNMEILHRLLTAY